MRDRFNEVLYYSPTSPTGLRWKVSRGRAKKDSVAGCLKSDGYYRLKVDGKDYQAHRVIWVLHNGDIPQGFVIDHIDRNPCNNDIDNLRQVSIQKNNLNRGNIQTNHEYLHKKNAGWQVSIPIGVFNTEQEAIIARDQALAQLGIAL